VIPSSVYRPFPYDNDAQRATFEAFLACAAAHGVRYEGPFTDSTGNSLLFRLAPGEAASPAQRQAVNTACPQMTVGTFGTRIGPVDVPKFERAATDFAACLRSHGSPNYPAPTFGQGDPLAAFWRLPIDWSSSAFTEAAKACVHPLQAYVFPEGG
jgi:hypothetical protein